MRARRLTTQAQMIQALLSAGYDPSVRRLIDGTWTMSVKRPNQRDRACFTGSSMLEVVQATYDETAGKRPE